MQINIDEDFFQGNKNSLLGSKEEDRSLEFKQQAADGEASLSSSEEEQEDERLPAGKLDQFAKKGIGRPTLSKPNRRMPGKSFQKDGMNNLQQQLQQLAKQQLYRRKVEDFILQFNKDPKNAVAGLSPKKIAKKLFQTPGIDKDVLGQYFARPDAVQVFNLFCARIDFKGVEVDISLRMLLSKFRLRGEEQQVDRILRVFAQTWTRDNSDRGCAADDIHVLCYSLIMLNTDAHSGNIQRKMTIEQFVRNTSAVVPSVSEAFLREMYHRIVDQKFQTKIDQIEKIYGRLKLLNSSNIREGVDVVKQLSKGSLVMKYCRNGTTASRVLFLHQERICWRSSTDPDETPRFILIDDIVDLSLGLATENMAKHKVQPEFDPLCFSFITKSRTLDLRATEQQSRSKWVSYISKRIIQRRDTKRRIQEVKFNSVFSKQKIQQIWMVDILPHWDRHWNHRSRQSRQEEITGEAGCATCLPFYYCLKKKSAFQECRERQSEQIGKSASSIRTPILNQLWRMGLPQVTRRVLWGLAVGNRIEMTKELYRHHKSKALKRKKLRNLQKTENQFEKIVKKQGVQEQLRRPLVNMLSAFGAMRPDVLALPALVQIARHIYLHIGDEEQAFLVFANVMHSHHLMAFFRSNMNEVWIRVVFFDYLLQMKASSVFMHFKALDLTSDLFLINWMLSLFACSIDDPNIVSRILDCFFLEGEIYLYRVAICLIAYHELELKTSTFEEAMRRLNSFKDLSEVVLFQMIGECEVSEADFQKYVSRRQIAMQNTVVQEILLL